MRTIGEQYLGYGWFGVAMTTLFVFFILFNIWRAHGKTDLFVRRIPGLNALDDAIGRATEMGRPVLMVPGLGYLNAISVQALNIFAYVTRLAGQFNTPIRLLCANASVYTVAQEVIRETYQSEGISERYDVDSVQFVSDRQFAFAAGVSGVILREKVAAAFFLGEFYAESMIFAETANSVGAIQIAGSTQTTQTPFFIAACDYVLIGDEFYAASAYLSREPVLVGSLIGQDWCKIAICLLIVLGTAYNSAFVQMSLIEAWQPEGQVGSLSYGSIQSLPEERFATPDDGFFHDLFFPDLPTGHPAIDVPTWREEKAPPEVPEVPE